MDEQYRGYLRDGEQAGMRYSLEVPREAMRGETGIQTGNLAGASLDFKDYREYQPGDDLRRIDWSVYGRSDMLIVKLFREEVCPHIDIIIDCSRSMALPGSRKTAGVLGLAAVMAAAAANARCSHAAWMIREGVHPVMNGTDSPGAWTGITFESSETLDRAWHTMPARWRKNGMRVLISDLLWAGDPLQSMRIAAENAAALTVIQVSARTDIEPTRRGNTRLTDMETGEELEVFIDAVVEKRYREAVRRHQQSWYRACRQVGAVMVPMIAEDIVETWQLNELQKNRILGVA